MSFNSFFVPDYFLDGSCNCWSGNLLTTKTSPAKKPQWCDQLLCLHLWTEPRCSPLTVSMPSLANQLLVSAAHILREDWFWLSHLTLVLDFGLWTLASRSTLNSFLLLNINVTLSGTITNLFSLVESATNPQSVALFYETYLQFQLLLPPCLLPPANQHFAQYENPLESSLTTFISKAASVHLGVLTHPPFHQTDGELSCLLQPSTVHVSTRAQIMLVSMVRDAVWLTCWRHQRQRQDVCFWWRNLGESGMRDLINQYKYLQQEWYKPSCTWLCCEASNKVSQIRFLSFLSYVFVQMYSF